MGKGEPGVPEPCRVASARSRARRREVRSTHTNSCWEGVGAGTVSFPVYSILELVQQISLSAQAEERRLLAFGASQFQPSMAWPGQRTGRQDCQVEQAWHDSD